jgi:hypothetical protein
VHVRMVLRHHKLYAKASKCRFGRSSVGFLGHVISEPPSPHQHNTTSKVERVHGVIADVPRAFAGYRRDGWPELAPLAEFAINDSASSLGSGPRATRPSTPTAASAGPSPRPMRQTPPPHPAPARPLLP